MGTPEQPGAACLTPEQARAFLQRDAANLAKRLNNGGTLSAGERKHLVNLTAGGSGGEPAYAANQAELAEILGVDRKTVQRWMRSKAAPPTRPDGRYEIAAWRLFKGTRRAGQRDLETQSAEEKARQVALQNEKLEVQVEILRKDYVRADDVAASVSAMILAAKRVLLGIPSALAPQVVGVPVREAETLLLSAINHALAQLHEDPLGDSSAKDTEDGAETERTDAGGAD